MFSHPQHNCPSSYQTHSFIQQAFFFRLLAMTLLSLLLGAGATKEKNLLSQNLLSRGGDRQTNRLLQYSVGSAKGGKVKGALGAQTGNRRSFQAEEIACAKDKGKTMWSNWINFSLAGANSKSIVSRSAASRKLWPWKLHLLGWSSPGPSETSPLT